MRQTVLITGATGFIGSRVLNLLLKENINIIAIIRKNSSIDQIKLRADDKIVITNDLFSESEAWWNNVCSKVDIVMHVAWFAEHKLYINSEKNLICLEGSMKMAKGALSAGIKKFVGVGTCLEYQITDEILTINTKLEPISLYAKCKVKLYQYLVNLFEKRKTTFAWCRIFFTYGPGEPVGKLHTYLRNSLRSGHDILIKCADVERDYIHVDEVAQRLVEVALGNSTGPINICSGTSKTIKQIAIEMAKEVGVKNPKIIYGDDKAEFKKIVGSPGSFNKGLIN